MLKKLLSTRLFGHNERKNVMLKKLIYNNDGDDEFRFINAHHRCRDVSQYRLHIVLYFWVLTLNSVLNVMAHHMEVE